jgi:hypothetical protein
VNKEIPPAGTPVDQKLYNDACQKVRDLEVELSRYRRRRMVIRNQRERIKELEQERNEYKKLCETMVGIAEFDDEITALGRKYGIEVRDLR